MSGARERAGAQARAGAQLEASASYGWGVSILCYMCRLVGTKLLKEFQQAFKNRLFGVSDFRDRKRGYDVDF